MGGEGRGQDGSKGQKGRGTMSVMSVPLFETFRRLTVRPGGWTKSGRDKLELSLTGFKSRLSGS